MSVENYITLNQLKKTTEALLIKINEDGDLKVSKTSVQAALSDGVLIGSIGDVDLYAPKGMTQDQVNQAIQEYLTYNYSSLIVANLTDNNGSYRLDRTYNQLLSLLFGQHVFVIVKTFNVDGYYDGGQYVVSSSGSGPILYPNYHMNDGILEFSCISVGICYRLQVTSSGEISYSQNSVGEKADWEQTSQYANSYILNKPAIKTGDGQNSIIAGMLEPEQDSATYTLLITGAKGATEYSYTTEDTLPSGLSTYSIAYCANGTTSATKYHKIRNIDTTNHTIELSGTCSPSANITNETLLIYYKKENVALGEFSFVGGGKYNSAIGNNSFVQGAGTIASALYSHAEGYLTVASGPTSHAEGSNTCAKGIYVHAEGLETFASGLASHAEGNKTQAKGGYAHSEGGGTIATHAYQHVSGTYNVQDPSSAGTIYKGNYVEIVGNGADDANRSNARTLDWSGNEVLAGKLTVGSGPANDMDVATKQYVDTIAASAGGQSDWQQNDNTAGDYIKNKPALKAGDKQNSIIEGYIQQNPDGIVYTVTFSGEANATTYTYTCQDSGWSYNRLVSGASLIVYTNETQEKYIYVDSADATTFTVSTTLNSSAAIVNGTLKVYYRYQNWAKGDNSHAEGSLTMAIGQHAHAEGYSTVAFAAQSHAQGYGNRTVASYSHAEGYNNTIKQSASSGHVQGMSNVVEGGGAHAEGVGTKALGMASHAEGANTIAKHAYQHVFGLNNIEDPSTTTNMAKGTYVEIVGNGTNTSNRSNARTLDWSGNEILSGKLTVGADPTAAMDVVTKQYFETNVSTLIQAALAEYGDGDTASYGYPSVNGVEF